MSARDDYDRPPTLRQHERMCDEIDRLRTIVKAATRFVDEFTDVVEDNDPAAWALVFAVRGVA